MGEPNESFIQVVERESFTVEGTELMVEDRLNQLCPWCSERILWIVGTDCYYSVVPICPCWHHLLCFTYCKDIMRQHESGFYHHALVLGCGGGAVPKWMLEEYPSLQVDVVERSPEILRICKKYFLNEWEASDRLRYHLADAAEYEAEDGRYQFVFCDLFDGTSLAPVVCERKFAKKMRKMICDDGTLVINCGWHNLKEVKQIYQKEFRHVEELKRESWQTQVVIARGRK